MLCEHGRKAVLCGLCVVERNADDRHADAQTREDRRHADRLDAGDRSDRAARERHADAQTREDRRHAESVAAEAEIARAVEDAAFGAAAEEQLTRQAIEDAQEDAADDAALARAREDAAARGETVDEHAWRSDRLTDRMRTAAATSRQREARRLSDNAVRDANEALRARQKDRERRRREILDEVVCDALTARAAELADASGRGLTPSARRRSRHAAVGASNAAYRARPHHVVRALESAPASAFDLAVHDPGPAAIDAALTAEIDVFEDVIAAEADLLSQRRRDAIVAFATERFGTDVASRMTWRTLPGRPRYGPVSNGPTGTSAGPDALWGRVSNAEADTADDSFTRTVTARASDDPGSAYDVALAALRDVRLDPAGAFASVVADLGADACGVGDWHVATLPVDFTGGTTRSLAVSPYGPVDDVRYWTDCDWDACVGRFDAGPDAPAPGRDHDHRHPGDRLPDGVERSQHRARADDLIPVPTGDAAFCRPEVPWPSGLVAAAVLFGLYVAYGGWFTQFLAWGAVATAAVSAARLPFRVRAYRRNRLVFDATQAQIAAFLASRATAPAAE